MKSFWPKIKVLSVIVLSSLTMGVKYSHATVITINPSADGAIYTCSSCNPVSDGGYVLVANYIQGIVEFSLDQVNQPITSAILSLNPYGLPLHGETIEVYGYASTDGILTAADGFAGSFLGAWDMPVGLGYGQDTYFDVSDFLSTIDSPYVGFNLRSYTGTDVFSSLEYNYGHPSQLTVTTVPEPASLLLLFVGITSLFIIRKNKIRISPESNEVSAQD